MVTLPGVFGRGFTVAITLLAADESMAATVGDHAERGHIDMDHRPG